MCGCVGWPVCARVWLWLLAFYGLLEHFVVLCEVFEGPRCTLLLVLIRLGGLLGRRVVRGQ